MRFKRFQFRSNGPLWGEVNTAWWILRTKELDVRKFISLFLTWINCWKTLSCCLCFYIRLMWRHSKEIHGHSLRNDSVIIECRHYSDVIMGAMDSQITSFTIVCLTVYPGADHRKHQNSASLAFVRGIHRWPVNSPHKGSVTRKWSPVILHFCEIRTSAFSIMQYIFQTCNQSHLQGHNL